MTTSSDDTLTTSQAHYLGDKARRMSKHANATYADTGRKDSSPQRATRHHHAADAHAAAHKGYQGVGFTSRADYHLAASKKHTRLAKKHERQFNVEMVMCLDALHACLES